MPIAHVSWRGASGQNYQFQIDPIGTAYRPISGVYVFVYQQNGVWYCLYVGETGDLNDRLNTGLQQHHAWPRIRTNGATHIGTLHVPGARQTRLDIETDLCQGCNPPCNQ